MITPDMNRVAVCCVFCCASLASTCLPGSTMLEGRECTYPRPAILMINHINFVDPFVDEFIAAQHRPNGKN
jgi:hypothetical protein